MRTFPREEITPTAESTSDDSSVPACPQTLHADFSSPGWLALAEVLTDCSVRGRVSTVDCGRSQPEVSGRGRNSPEALAEGDRRPGYPGTRAPSPGKVRRLSAGAWFSWPDDQQNMARVEGDAASRQGRTEDHRHHPVPGVPPKIEAGSHWPKEATRDRDVRRNVPSVGGLRGGHVSRSSSMRQALEGLSGFALYLWSTIWGRRPTVSQRKPDAERSTDFVRSDEGVQAAGSSIDRRGVGSPGPNPQAIRPIVFIIQNGRPPERGWDLEAWLAHHMAQGDPASGWPQGCHLQAPQRIDGDAVQRR